MPTHLSPETMAKWLSGRLEHDVVLAEVVPHLVRSCPSCRASYEEVVRLQAEVDHWDELVAVQEFAEAPELFAKLGSHSFERQLLLVAEDEQFHHWGLCQLLLRRSSEMVSDEPARALELAEVAARAARHLGPAYDENWVDDLRARSLAYIGNALRVLGEVRGAEAAFRRAAERLHRSTSGNRRIEAELLSFQAALLRDQRHFADSLAVSERALALFRASEDEAGVAKALIQQALTLEEAGAVDAAVRLLRASDEEIDRAKIPRLHACARYNMLCCLIGAGHFEDALLEVAQVRQLYEECGKPLDHVRLGWAEGVIQRECGLFEPAEEALERARKSFAERGMAYDAALVALDLSILYAQQERRSEVARLAQEVLPVFETRELYCEAMATLLMARRATEEQQVSESLLRDLADALHRKRRGPRSA